MRMQIELDPHKVLESKFTATREYLAAILHESQVDKGMSWSGKTVNDRIQKLHSLFRNDLEAFSREMKVEMPEVYIDLRK